jgi:hypothetical protein
MTVTIDLTPDQEAAIRQQAEAQGITVEQWVRGAVDASVPVSPPAHLQDADPKEWFRQLKESVYSHPGAGHGLPDEAFSRESIYDERP